MIFELQKTGEMAVPGKPGQPVIMKDVYESAEEAFERYLCEILHVERKKVDKVVEITIPATNDSPPIKTTAKRPCLPNPAQEIVDAAEPGFNQEGDISYRMGYVQGYRDREEKKEAAGNLVLDRTGKTAVFVMELHKAAATHAEEHVENIAAVYLEALKIKRNDSYASGYWQGYSDKAGGVMPKFVNWDNPSKQAEEFKW